MKKAKMNGKKDNGEYYCNMLIKMGIPHTKKTCTNSMSVEFKMDGKRQFYFFPFGESVDRKYLNFIHDTKQEIICNSERLNIEYKKPRYIGCAPCENVHYTNAVEIDISSAYWKQAYNIGIISEQTYRLGLFVPKNVRLIAFGSAATKKDVFYFDGYRAAKRSMYSLYSSTCSAV